MARNRPDERNHPGRGDDLSTDCGDTTTEGGLGGRHGRSPGGAAVVYYDVTVRGEPGDVLRRAFSDVTVRRAAGVTVLSADLDQAGLHGLLGRIADLGLVLVGVRLRKEGS